MKKFEELSNVLSCLSKAKNDERLFVLLARDAAAPETIRFWTRERIRLGKNRDTDPQIREALACADLMEEERGKAKGARASPGPLRGSWQW